MSYSFTGVFVERPEKSLLELEELFEGYAREIETPFVGDVISLKDADVGEHLDNDESVSYDRQWEQEKVKARILEKSKDLLRSNVAYIEYQTFGGQLDFVYGFACRNGVVIENSERCTEDEGEPDGNDIFLALQKIVGARSPSIYFAPFERGYFPNTD